MKETPQKPPVSGLTYALASAVLFGASTPFAKLLLGRIDPVLLAGLLYLGSGCGLFAWRFFAAVSGTTVAEARLARADLPWLAGAVLFGGVLAPILLMIGLSMIPGATASLLLNLEGVLTALLAWFVFRENFDRRIALGMATITIGGVILSWEGRPETGMPWGSFAIAGACLAWGIDNNLTRKVSAGDPVQIAAIKGVGAGIVNLGIAFARGAERPDASTILASGALGLVGYGISLTFFVLALRSLGTARTGAYFSIAPFVGAAISFPLLGELPTLGFFAAAALMAAGVWLHLTERHEHEHIHEPIEHDHLHTHDAHHQHGHTPEDPAGEPHSHSHRHDVLTHTHAHYPDIHHRHVH